MTVPQVITPGIPGYLVCPIEPPVCSNRLNGDLVQCIQSLRTALDHSNADKAAIKAAIAREAAHDPD